MEIIIEFPKKPKTIQRSHAQSIGKKCFNYYEDEFNSIIKADKIDDNFKAILDKVAYWSGVSCKVNDKEIDPRTILSLIRLKSNKIPPTNLEWYNIGYLHRDIKEVKEIFESQEYRYEMRSTLEGLQEKEFVEVIEYEKKYRLNKIKLIEFIKEKTITIKEILPDFDNSDILKAIDSLKEDIEIKEYDPFGTKRQESEDEGESEPKGEEYVDWYDEIKWHKEVLDLLKKIEENTKKD